MSRRPQRAAKASQTHAPQCSIEPNKNEVVGAAKTRKPIHAKFHRAAPQTQKSNVSSSHSTASNDPETMAGRDWVRDLCEKSPNGIRRDFISYVRGFVPENLSYKAFEQHPEKNRFEDILLLDESRVRLRHTTDDYIHASRVKVSDEVQFICAQGPLENTAEDFWHMILQEQTRVIVQLCRNTESGERKCDEYFDLKRPMKFHGIRVSVEKSSQVRAVHGLVKSELLASHGDQTHKVTHYLYAAWPDHFIPDGTAVIRELHKYVAKERGRAPVVVHCSAGVGRTGTFVAVEMVLHMLLERKDNDSSVVDIVKRLREQRLHAIQNDQQYLYLHMCVLDVLKELDPGVNSPEVEDFVSQYNGLVARKRNEQIKKAAEKKRRRSAAPSS